MILAANSDATAEVRAVALAGVREVQSAMKKNTARRPAMEQIDHEIDLFLQNPEQNTPKLKSSWSAGGRRRFSLTSAELALRTRDIQNPDQAAGEGARPT